MKILKRAREHYGPYIRWKKSLARELEFRSTLVDTAKGPVEYAVYGESGPYVSVMHGGPGGYDQAEALFSGLFDKGFRILSWSRPGYIRTPLSAGRTFAEQARTFAALLDALEIRSTAVLGYSAGGPPAVHLAARFPDRVGALILECAVSRPYELNRNNIGEQILFGHLMFHGPYLWLADVLAHHAPLLIGWATVMMESSLKEDEVFRLMKDIMKDERRVRILMDLIRSMSPSRLRVKGLRNDLRQLASMGDLPFGQVQAPTLVIHGTDDLDVPAEHARLAAASVPDAELCLVPGGFHILALSDAAGEINETRIRFLKEHAPV